MSEKTDKLSAAYTSLADSEGGQHLMVWITETAHDIRKKALHGDVKVELGKAEGLDMVVQQINQMKGLPKIR